MDETHLTHQKVTQVTLIMDSILHTVYIYAQIIWLILVIQPIFNSMSDTLCIYAQVFID